jgi:hypothetical protein
MQFVGAGEQVAREGTATGPDFHYSRRVIATGSHGQPRKDRFADQEMLAKLPRQALL